MDADGRRTESTKLEKWAPNRTRFMTISRTFRGSSSGRRPNIGGSAVCVRVAQDLRSHYTGKRNLSSVTSVCWLIIQHSSRNQNCFPPWITWLPATTVIQISFSSLVGKIFSSLFSSARKEEGYINKSKPVKSLATNPRRKQHQLIAYSMAWLVHFKI